MAGRVLITGATGFLGRHLAAHLAASGRSELVAVSQSGGEVAGTRAVACDLIDARATRRLIETERPDVVYHFAGAARVSGGGPFAEYFERNALATIHLVRAIAETSPGSALLLASSVHVYGNTKGRVTEAVPARPANAYGFTKYLAERSLEALALERHTVQMVVARLDACIGPGQGPGFATADLSRKVAAAPGSGGRIEVGDLTARRRLLDARDAAAILPLLLERARRPYDVFNVASPREVKIGEVLDALVRISKKSPQIQSRPDLHANRFQGLDLSLDKLQTAVGTLRVRPIEQTLTDIYAEAAREAGQSKSA